MRQKLASQINGGGQKLLNKQRDINMHSITIQIMANEVYCILKTL